MLNADHHIGEVDDTADDGGELVVGERVRD